MTTEYSLFLHGSHPGTLDSELEYYTKLANTRCTVGMEMLEKLVNVTADDDILRIALAVPKPNAKLVRKPRAGSWMMVVLALLGVPILQTYAYVCLTNKETEDVSPQSRSHLRFICKMTAKELCASKAFCAATDIINKDGHVVSSELGALKQSIADYKALLALS